jgi:hypothetical protein
MLFRGAAVLEFDGAGNLLKSWGGPGPGYDWPTSEHSIFVDASGNIWITGNGATDRQALKFTNDGNFIMQIGHSSKAEINSLDTTLLARPAGIEVDEKARELYIADGYGNRRVIVFDSDSGKFKRMWGAYGNAPSDADPGAYDPSAAPGKQFRTPVHCVHLSNDGLVYVCDRVNDRIQVFTKEGKFLKEFSLRKQILGNGSAYDLAFSRDQSQGYLLVADASVPRGKNARCRLAPARKADCWRCRRWLELCCYWPFPGNGLNDLGLSLSRIAKGKGESFHFK